MSMWQIFDKTSRLQYDLDGISCHVICMQLVVDIESTLNFKLIWARGYKTFFMLNSTEHKVLIANKYENIKKFSIFRAQISLECYFSCS